MKKIYSQFIFKALFIFLLCLITTEISISQIQTAFTLKGECNIPDGLVHLGLIDESYNSSKVEGYDANLINGHFSIEAPITDPSAFRLFIKQKGIVIYVSNMFFVEKGLQTISINAREYGSLPTIDNASMKELKSDYTLWFQSYNNEEEKLNFKRDSLSLIYNNSLPLKETSELMNGRVKLSVQNDTLLLQYTKKHPKSFVALWKLAERLTDGYEVIFDSIFTCFSQEIKATYTAKVLTEKLKTARIGKIGNRFPDLYLSDSKTKILVPVVQTKNKYTLIDFWFSSCGPCKAQLQELKRLYDSYFSRGFNIIGISVDQRENISNWRNAINSNSLTWPQYLDLDLKESQKLSILSYPSNFLLNKEGIIIAKDISLYDLSKILEDNLK